MPSLVTYTDQQPPANRYPHRIIFISPPRAGVCCFSEMAEIGPPETDARWAAQYRRCRQGGVAVRVILRESLLVHAERPRVTPGPPRGPRERHPG